MSGCCAASVNPVPSGACPICVLSEFPLRPDEISIGASLMLWGYERRLWRVEGESDLPSRFTLDRPIEGAVQIGSAPWVARRITQEVIPLPWPITTCLRRLSERFRHHLCIHGAQPLRFIMRGTRKDCDALLVRLQAEGRLAHDDETVRVARMCRDAMKDILREPSPVVSLPFPD